MNSRDRIGDYLHRTPETPHAARTGTSRQSSLSLRMPTGIVLALIIRGKPQRTAAHRFGPPSEASILRKSSEFPPGLAIKDFGGWGASSAAIRPSVSPDRSQFSPIRPVTC